MKALIFNNTVVDVSNEEFEVHNGMFWQEAPETVEIGYIFDGIEFKDPDNRSEEQKTKDELNSLRFERNKLLASTDWWVLPDNNPTPDQIAYRQALRDITEHYSSIYDVVWPEKP